MADEVTTSADTGTSTADVAVVQAPAEQQTSPDAQAVEAPKGDADTETSLLGGEVKPDAEAPKADEAAAVIVPEKYELSHEGLELDAVSIEAASPVFKELGLSNEAANKLMPVAAQFRDRVTEQTLQGLNDNLATQKAEWLTATKADPDIGGGNLDATLQLAAKGLDHFGFTEGSDFRKLLTDTGLGNHPDMVRIMRGVGEMISEDGFPRSGAGTSTLSAKDILYPTSKGA